MRNDIDKTRSICFTCKHMDYKLDYLCVRIRKDKILTYNEPTPVGVIQSWIDSCSGFEKDWIRILKYGKYKHRVFDQNGDYI